MTQQMIRGITLTQADARTAPETPDAYVDALKARFCVLEVV